MGTLLLLAAMAWCFLAGGLCAGDYGLMPMRGNAPDGRLPVNRVMVRTPSAWADDAVLSDTRKPGARKPAYVQWKDMCVRKPRMVAGQALEVESPGGFGLAPRYVRRWTDGNGDFIELLVREFTGIKPGG